MSLKFSHPTKNPVNWELFFCIAASAALTMLPIGCGKQQAAKDNATVSENKGPEGAVSVDSLADMRNKINGIDSTLIHLLAQRMDLAEEIGRFKSRNNIPVLQPGRWNEVLERAVVKGGKLGLSEGFVKEYMDAVHRESLRRQEFVKTVGPPPQK